MKKKILKLVNRFQLVNAYNKGTIKNLAHPLELIVEITNRCNLSCIMCPRASMKRPQGFMEFELFKNIIDQVKDSIELVYISGGLGEPLLHPYLPDMIKYCRDNDVYVGLSTNCTLLTQERCGALLNHPPHLMLLALDAATKKLYEKIREGANYEATMQNVEYFLKEKIRRRCRDPHTIAQMIYMSENREEKSYFYDKWKGNKGVNGVRLKKYIHLHGAKYVPDISKELEQCETLSCILPWRQLNISWSGDLALCCRDLDFKYPIGNVNEVPIKELWNSKKMIAYRKALSTGQKKNTPLCKECLTTKTSVFTRFASICFDTLTIRKLLPLVEKFVIKTGMKVLDY